MSDLASKLAKLPADKRSALISLLKGANTKKESNSLKARDRSNRVAASYQQEQLWFIDNLAQGDTQNNVSALITLTGNLVKGQLEHALNEIVKRHESLRTKFEEEEGIVTQVVEDWRYQELEFIDLSDKQEIFKETIDAYSSKPFMLAKGPLYRNILIKTSEEKHHLLWVSHHIIWDAWSYTVFIKELATLYNGEYLNELNVQYPDFSLWQRDHIAGERLEELNSFWKERMKNTEVTELITDYNRPKDLKLDGHRYKQFLSDETLHAVKKVINENKVTQYMTLLTAFKVLLQKYTKQEEIVVGTPSANRTNLETEKLIGFFVNMIPIKSTISEDMTFENLLLEVKKSVLESFSNQDLPFEKIVAAANPKREPSRHPLFQIEFTSESMGSDGLPNLNGLNLTHETLHDSGSRFDMSFITYESNGKLVVLVEYNKHLYKEDTIKQLVNNYEKVLLKLCNNPKEKIKELSYVDETSLNKITQEWASGGNSEVVIENIVEVFEQIVLKYPNNIAVSYKEESYTYSELNKRANNLARYLIEKGTTKETFVGICLDRSIEMIVSILAVLKAGGTYIPIDSEYPQERINHILSDSQASMIITQEKLVEKTKISSAFKVLIDKEQVGIQENSVENIIEKHGSNKLAYVLYTSGSTGKPKGVMIEEISVVNFIKNISEDYNITSSDTIIQFALLGFDVSVFEIFSALLNGGRLCIASYEDRVSPDNLTELLINEKVTVAELPPALLPLLSSEKFPALRLISVGGEAPAGVLVENWATEKRRFFNGYGPTETTVAVTLMECEGKYIKSPPIGRPMKNHSAFVLDEQLKPVPEGVPGELHIGGIGLAKGYLNHEKLTNEKFISSPFKLNYGDKIYKTGDLVRWLPNGTLEFLGRVDRQVKIRGFRIELEEIENVLLNHSSINSVAVTIFDHENYGKKIVAYFSTTADKITKKDILKYCKESLPHYMIPSLFVELDSIPLTPNGKIAKQELPQPDFESSSDVNVKLPKDEIEEEIASKIFLSVLGVKVSSTDDSFFDLGGNSLQATQIVSKIRKKYMIEITLAEFFNNTTVEKLALIVKERMAINNDNQKQLLETLSAIESLSDNDVAAKLKQLQTSFGGSSNE
jgi:amino acid adenylation domain-containing protein